MDCKQQIVSSFNTQIDFYDFDMLLFSYYNIGRNTECHDILLLMLKRRIVLTTE